MRSTWVQGGWGGRWGGVGSHAGEHFAPLEGQHQGSAGGQRDIGDATKCEQCQWYSEMIMMFWDGMDEYGDGEIADGGFVHREYSVDYINDNYDWW